jgi:cytochrome c-type biogenesis protein CcmH
MRRRTAFWSMTAIAAFAWQPFVALAADAVPTEKDPQSASRVVKLSEKLRCLVCQNQSIADSNAELAQDLRRQIREQVAAGKTDDEIVTYMVARYGDFVLYEPPVKPTTVLLWAGPALLLVAGFAGLAVLVRARRAEPDVPPLTAEERDRAARLLAGDRGKDVA